MRNGTTITINDVDLNAAGFVEAVHVGAYQYATVQTFAEATGALGSTVVEMRRSNVDDYAQSVAYSTPVEASSAAPISTKATIDTAYIIVGVKTAAGSACRGTIVVFMWYDT